MWVGALWAGDITAGPPAPTSTCMVMGLKLATQSSHRRLAGGARQPSHWCGILWGTEPTLTVWSTKFVVRVGGEKIALAPPITGTGEVGRQSGSSWGKGSSPLVNSSAGRSGEHSHADFTVRFRVPHAERASPLRVPRQHSGAKVVSVRSVRAACGAGRWTGVGRWQERAGGRERAGGWEVIEEKSAVAVVAMVHSPQPSHNEDG